MRETEKKMKNGRWKNGRMEERKKNWGEGKKCNGVYEKK